MVVLELGQIVARGLFHSGIPAAGPLGQHLTLWVCFAGAALAARDGQLLAFASGQLLAEGRLRDASAVLSATVAAAVSAALSVAGVELVRVERQAGTLIVDGLPVWIAQLVLPVAFALIALRLAARAGRGWPARAVAAAGVVAGAFLAWFFPLLEGRPSWPGLGLLLLGTLLGGPLFAALGGAAALLFMTSGVTPAAVLVETYRLTVHPTLPAIPMFTLVGFLLAEGGASGRLLHVFRACFGWAPGGTAVVCALVCAFFTVFSGGSGVTILALGALMLQALRRDGYGDRFSLGLLTASGSLGLLFPPALPLILYGIVAEVAIDDLFVGGILPGLLLVGLLAGWGVWHGRAARIPRTRFTGHDARAALWQAKWELLLPVLALGALLSGLATVVETAAVTVLYAMAVQWLVHRELSSPAALIALLGRCVALVGGVLLILGVAMGLTSWLVDAQVPSRVLAWVQQHIESPLVFLLALNAFLLVVGCLMDIFSATVVVVPLIVPLGALFGIDPVHLGIVFVANLELGYLTPPVGLNLFLASYRFERPLLEVYRASLPPLVILGAGVLLITYLPLLSTGLLSLVGR
jgi:tripartite ATP-independent transporter DctM subunit